MDDRELMLRPMKDLVAQLTEEDARKVRRALADALFEVLDSYGPSQPIQRDMTRRLLCGALAGMGNADSRG